MEISQSSSVQKELSTPEPSLSCSSSDAGSEDNSEFENNDDLSEPDPDSDVETNSSWCDKSSSSKVVGDWDVLKLDGSPRTSQFDQSNVDSDDLPVPRVELEVDTFWRNLDFNWAQFAQKLLHRSG